MKPICCDTSFLLSLYGQDSHSERATAFARRLRQPISLTVFNEFELENALRLAAWRGVLPATKIEVALNWLQTDYLEGRILLIPCNLSEILEEARRLSKLYTLTGGFRAFDIILVSAAIHLKAGTFLSFDTNQRKLAAKEGLKLNN